jgi:hypothetical protein
MECGGDPGRLRDDAVNPASRPARQSGASRDELLRVDQAARSELAQLDEQEPEVIDRHRDEEMRKTIA